MTNSFKVFHRRTKLLHHSNLFSTLVTTCQDCQLARKVRRTVVMHSIFPRYIFHSLYLIFKLDWETCMIYSHHNLIYSEKLHILSSPFLKSKKPLSNLTNYLESLATPIFHSIRLFTSNIDSHHIDTTTTRLNSKSSIHLFHSNVHHKQKQ